MKLKYTKTDLIEQLEAKLPELVAYDKELTAGHYAKNKEVAKARRECLRELVKMKDDKLAEMNVYNYFNRGQSGWPDGSSCPLSVAVRLDNAIKFLKRDSRKTITVNEGDELAKWLVWEHPSVRGSATVCS